MAEPYIGEIRVFGFNFQPTNWALCNGQLLPIRENTALFSILGTQYGGDGVTTFGLPNLQGRVPVHPTAGEPSGQLSGTEACTLTLTELPSHPHQVNATAASATSNVAAANVWAGTAAKNAYSSGVTKGPISPLALTPTGGGQPHENRQPYQVASYCIALVGLYPSRP